MMSKLMVARKPLVWAGIAFLAAGVGGYWLVTKESAPSPARAAAPAPQIAPTTVVARGRIEPLDRMRVIHGHERTVLQSVLVREGDVVRKGDILAELGSAPLLRAKLALEERRLAEMIATAEQVKAPAKTASRAAQEAITRQRQADLQKAEQEFKRTAQLRENNFVPLSRYDDRRSEFDAARYALSESQSTLAALTEVRDVDVVVANTRVATQRAAVDQAHAELDRAIIRAPINGSILAIFSRAGELLADEGLLQMADMTALIAIAEVNEIDIPRVAVGQTAVIRSPLLPSPIEATVTRTSETIFKQKRPTSDVLIGRDARIAEIEIQPKSKLPPLVGAELTVEIRVR